MSVHSKFKHDGKNYTIEVGEEGRFSSIIGDGEQIYHDTLKGLQDKIVRMTRRAAVRIALPATLVRASRRHWSSRDANSTTMHSVTITGMHQRNRYFLIQFSDGKRDHVDNYHDGLFKPEMDQKEYHRLLKAKTDATEVFDKFEEKWKFENKDIEARVKAAEKAAGVEGGEED